ncbi:hypothetical protein FLK63_20315 [Burkholderia gladioli]|nr:hypothetical protein [Burkholderia gladioli]
MTACRWCCRPCRRSGCSPWCRPPPPPRAAWPRACRCW